MPNRSSIPVRMVHCHPVSGDSHCSEAVRPLHSPLSAIAVLWLEFRSKSFVQAQDRTWHHDIYPTWHHNTIISTGAGFRRWKGMSRHDVLAITRSGSLRHAEVLRGSGPVHAMPACRIGCGSSTWPHFPTTRCLLGRNGIQHGMIAPLLRQTASISAHAFATRNL
jgi:hypothetical protein